MNKNVLSYLVEIFLIVCLLLFSFIIINNNPYNKIDKQFVEDNNIAITINNNNPSHLKRMNDTYAINNIDNTIIRITNYNNNSIDYKLFMRIKKEKDLDFNKLKIKLDNEIFRLKSKYDYEDENYLYFDLTHRKINNTNDLNFAMWLDENTDTNNNYNFSYNFYIERITSEI